MASICLISKLNGWGLTKDVHLVSEILTRAGMKVSFKQWDEPKSNQNYDLNIHLELVGSHHFRNARKNILIPNPEWFLPVWVNSKGRFNATLVKTHHAVHTFNYLGFKNVQNVGFSTKDIYQPIPRQPEFIHMAGNSRFKGTIAVIEAWNRNPKWPTIHIFNSFQDLTPLIKGKNIRYKFGYMNDLTHLQNECLYHVQPSESEGYGHVLYESLAVGSVLITTDAPPMNEITNAVKSPAKRGLSYNYAWLYHVTELEKVIREVLKMKPPKLDELSRLGRQEFIDKDVAFRKKFVEVIKHELGTK